MGYTGQRPSAVPLTTADLIDGSVTSDDIADLDAAKLTGTVNNARISLDAAEIPNLDTAKVTSGTFHVDRISEASVTQHVTATDLTPVRQDIAMLALYNAVSDNRVAYNLPYSFIDQFEDDTGVTTQTDVDNVSEYFASVYTNSGAFASDAYTSLLIHSDGVSGDFTDSSSYGHTVSKQGTITHTTGNSPKIGATSWQFNGSNGIKVPWHASLQFDADFTIEFWVYCPSALVTGDRLMSHWPNTHHANGGQWFVRATTDEADGLEFAFGSGGSHSTAGEFFNVNAWNYYVAERHGSNARIYVNGDLAYGPTSCHTGTTGDQQDITIGFYNPPSPSEFTATGYRMDALRISKGIARYTGSGGGAMTPPEDSSVANATGTLISDTQTSSVATTKMSGVILYKDNGSGASTLGTHLKIYLSANGGSNWHEVPSYGAVTPLFSTGVKMVRLGETTVTSGTAPVMKAVWASQASGTLETQLHGWAMNY